MKLSTVQLHGDEWKLEDIREDVEYVRTKPWHMAKWEPRPALVDKHHSSPFVGQKYDPDKITLVEDGWDHDHCQVCWWTLNNSSDPEHNHGYTTDGTEWLCKECYETFVNSDEFSN